MFDNVIDSSLQYHAVILNKDGEGVYINQRFAQTFANVLPEFSETGFYAILTKEDIKKYHKALMQCVVKNEPVAIQLFHTDILGSNICINWELSPERNNIFETIGVVAIGWQEIPLVINREEELAALAQKEQSLLLDKNGLLVFADASVKERFNNLYDIKVEEGDNVFHLIGIDAEVKQVLDMPDTLPDDAISFVKCNEERSLCSLMRVKKYQTSVYSGYTVTLLNKMVIADQDYQSNRVIELKQEFQPENILWDYSHKVRLPLSNIVGLTNIIMSDIASDDKESMLQKIMLLKREVMSLDYVMTAFINNLEDEV